MAEVECARLSCEACGQLTVHEVRYAGRLLIAIQCSRCGTSVTRDPAEARAEYMRDLEQRLLTKPRRLFRRALQNPQAFAVSLPRKLIAQPRKLKTEWRSVRQARRSTRGGPRWRRLQP